MPFKDPVERKKYNDLKYATAKENATICPICNKSYNMFTQNNHMKSKNHLKMKEIFELKTQVEVMKNLFNVTQITFDSDNYPNE